MTVLPSTAAPRSRLFWLKWGVVEQWCLQSGHRLGSLGLLLLLGGVAASVMKGRPLVPLGMAILLADLGLVGGLAGWWLARRQRRSATEARGLMIFNLVLLLLSVLLFALARLKIV